MHCVLCLEVVLQWPHSIYPARCCHFTIQWILSVIWRIYTWLCN